MALPQPECLIYKVIPCFPISAESGIRVGDPPDFGRIGNRGFPPRLGFPAKSGIVCTIGGTGIGDLGLWRTELATSHWQPPSADVRWRPEISIFEDQRQHLAPGSCLVLTWDEYPRFPDSAKSGIGDSLIPDFGRIGNRGFPPRFPAGIPDSRPNRESGEQELGISGSAVVAQIPVLGSAHWHGPVTKGGASGTAPHGTALHPRKGPLATSSHLPAGVHTGDSGRGAFECPIQVSHDARLLLVVSFIISRHWQRVILRQSAHQLYLDPCTDSDDVRCYPRTRSIQRLSQWNSSLSLGRITDGTGSMVVGRAASS